MEFWFIFNPIRLHYISRDSSHLEQNKDLNKKIFMNHSTVQVMAYNHKMVLIICEKFNKH